MSYAYIIVGLGKTGLSCAHYLLAQGYNIAVTDSRMRLPEHDVYLNLKARYPQLTAQLGSIEPALLQQAETIIISPGLPLSLPALCAARAKGIPIIGDINLFIDQLQQRQQLAPLIAITGTNGKSTVTALVGEMARAAGLNVAVGGNIGTPVMELLAQSPADLYVIELSSFQLELITQLPNAVVTVLNISADHLDRYASYEDYVAAKQRIFAGARCAIINKQEQATYPKLSTLPTIAFSFQAPDSGEFGIIEDDKHYYLAYGQKRLLDIDSLKIKGMPNWANALAALALAEAVNIPLASRLIALQSFKGLAHRCQWVRELKAVNWYNDSKGTNVGAARAAIEGLGAHMSGKIVLIAGGQGKQADFSPLRQPVRDYVRELILIGEDAGQIAKSLADCAPIKQADNLLTAVSLAQAAAQPGDAVLLSPACASFDMFDNFGHRGDVFCQYVNDL